jgi:hypothetical protein
MGQIAIYCRVSTDDQDHQERDLRAFCRARMKAAERREEIPRVAPLAGQFSDEDGGWGVSVLAQTGLSFDLSTASGTR